MDGVSVVDTGNNSQMLQLNVEAIAEVKVLTANYQAEYGRSSGLQITAVTKSGTNRFHGSVYDVKRNSDWNANSWVEQTRTAIPRPSRSRTTGATPSAVRSASRAARTSCSSSTATEYRPRTGGGTVNRFRVPTALERQGDFSQTRDNTGSSSRSSATTRLGSALHRDQHRRLLPGRRRRRPHSAEPAVRAGHGDPEQSVAAAELTQQAGENYNYEVTTPVTKTLTYQPSVRIDYQPTSEAPR